MYKILNGMQLQTITVWLLWVKPGPTASNASDHEH